LFTLLALNLPEECHVCSLSESLEEEILWLRHSQFLSRDAQFDLRVLGTNRDRGGGFPPTAPTHPSKKKAERDDGNEVEMHRPKISRKTVGIFDIDLCRGDDYNFH
jgi:hypothetical protein